MPLALDDGYTLPFRTPAEVVDKITGRVVESGLPQISGRYRPPLFSDVQEYRYEYARASTGPDQARVVAKFICDRVTDWDITIGGKPFPLTIDAVANKFPDVFADLVLAEVMKWKPKPEEEARGNS